MSDTTPIRPERRLAAVAAYAGGALTAAGALSIGVLLGQVLIARMTIPGAEAPPPRSSGLYGTGYADAAAGVAVPLRLAVLGDSTAAGYGVQTRAETPGALLATWIADAAKRPVRLTCPAVVGSVSAWLSAQVETALEAGVDLAIVFIGANDVTTRASESAAVRHLFEAVHALREAGAEVVVATCPDLGTIRPIQPPLRWLARRWSRQLAAAQTVAVIRAGGRVAEARRRRSRPSRWHGCRSRRRNTSPIHLKDTEYDRALGRIDTPDDVLPCPVRPRHVDVIVAEHLAADGVQGARLLQ